LIGGDLRANFGGTFEFLRMVLIYRAIGASVATTIGTRFRADQGRFDLIKIPGQ